MNNNVIIVGPDHYNTLGIVRSLGEKGISPIVVIFDAKSSFVLKSKYIKSGYLFDKADPSIINFIRKNWYSQNNPSVVIGSSDMACMLIDENLSKLKGFICANCNSKEGEVSRLMDKYAMNKAAEIANFEVPRSVFVSKDEKLNIHGVRLPCIVKPLESSFGNKSDIAICYTKNELETAYSVFEQQHIDVLVQDYIKADYEVGVMGCSFYNSGEIWIPDIIFKKRFSNKSAVYAEVDPIEKHPDFSEIIEKIKTLVKNVGYRGIFDVDLLCAGDKVYFIEMNMRNGAYGYGLSRSGSNFAYSWVREAVEQPIETGRLIHSTAIMCEFSDLIMLKENKVPLFQWISEYRKSSHMIVQWADFKPTFTYLLNWLKRH